MGVEYLEGYLGGCVSSPRCCISKLRRTAFPFRNVAILCYGNCHFILLLLYDVSLPLLHVVICNFITSKNGSRDVDFITSFSSLSIYRYVLVQLILIPQSLHRSFTCLTFNNSPGDSKVTARNFGKSVSFCQERPSNSLRAC